MSNEKLTMNFIRNDGIPFTNISFSSRPDKEILDYLKLSGWRYYSKKGEGTTGRWYPFTAEAKRGCDDFIKDFTEKFFPEQSSSLLAEDSTNSESGSSSSQDSSSGSTIEEQTSVSASHIATKEEIVNSDSGDELLLKIIEKSMDYELTPAAYEKIATMLKEKIINESVEFARFTEVIENLQDENRSLREENERLRQNRQAQDNKESSPAESQNISTGDDNDEPSYLINGESYKKHEIESLIEEDIQNIFRDLVPEPYIGGISVYGNPDKDEHIKILVQYGTENYEGEWREDDLFNVIADEHLQINGIPVDINPITPEKSGTIKEYLERLERLDAEDKENSEVAEETAVIPERVEQEKSGGNVETEPETSTVTDDTKNNEEKNITEADELFTRVTSEFYEKNKKTLDDYEKLKEAYIENNSRYIGDARLRRLFQGGHSAIVTLRMQELEDIIQQARSPEVASHAAVRYLNMFGTDEFTEEQQDSLFLRCGLGHISHSPNGSHFVSPAAEDISSFINQAYLFHKGEMEYLDDEAILDIVHKGGFEFRFDKEKEQLDIIKTNEDERTVGRVNYKPGYGFVISSYGYSESEVPYMIRNYANQFALVSPELSEIRQKHSLDDELARDFATLDSHPDVWLDLLNKGADPRKAIKVAAEDANLCDNLRWLINHIPENKLKEYFSDEEWADEVYEIAKSSVTNDKESWQDISDIGIDGFMQIAKLCGRGEYAEEYFHELIVENGFEKYYHNKYLNEFLALRYEDSKWSYVFYDRDFNEADGGTYTTTEAMNLTDFDKAAENIVAEHYQLGSFDPDGKTQSELYERAKYEENLSYANWEPLDYNRFRNFKSSSHLYKDNCIDILQRYRDNTLTDFERGIIANEERSALRKPINSKEVKESIAAVESVMRSSKFYVQKKNPATGYFEQKGQREVSVREARSLISPTDFASGIDRSAYHITADRYIDDDTNLHFASNDATQMLPEYVIPEEDMEVLREYLGTYVADHIKEHFDEIFSELTGAASPAASHEEPAEQVEQERTPETSDNTVSSEYPEQSEQEELVLTDKELETAKSVLPYSQYITTLQLAFGEERDFFVRTLKNIASAVENAPEIYATDSEEQHPIILRYFHPTGTESFVTEIGEDGEAFGFQCLNGDYAFAEWGYLDINEIKGIPMMQVDYHIPEGMTVERYLYQEHPDFFPQYAKFAEQKHEQNNDVSEQEILVSLINDACKKDEELRQSASVNSRDLFEAAYFDKVSEILIAEWNKGNKSDLARKLLDGNDDYKKEILGNYIDEVYDYLNNKSPLDIAKETGNNVEAIAESLKDRLSWDDIYNAAMGKGFGDPELTAKDNARGQIAEYALSFGIDIEAADSPEDAIDDFLENHNEVFFNKNGNLIIDYDVNKLNSEKTQNNDKLDVYIASTETVYLSIIDKLKNDGYVFKVPHSKVPSFEELKRSLFTNIAPYVVLNTDEKTFSFVTEETFEEDPDYKGKEINYLNENLEIEVLNPYSGLAARSYYNSKGTRELCHAIKEASPNSDEYKKAIEQIADYFVSQGVFNENSILVPAPQHTGKAEYTLDLALVISSKTKSPVADILRCKPHDTLYEQKKNGKEPVLEFYLENANESTIRFWKEGGDKVYLIDNVISTGLTFNKAENLIPGIIPAPYAVGNFAEITREDDRYLVKNLLEENPVEKKVVNRKYEITTYDTDSQADSKEDYATLEEAIKNAKDYLSNDYHKDEYGNPYYQGVGVYNLDSHKIEFTEGYFPIHKIFVKDIVKDNFILDKLADAGIEVVTDKAEFDRILESETILQKMAKENKIENLFISENDVNLDSEIDKLTINDIESQDNFIEISKKTPYILKECGLDDYPVNIYKQKLARAFFLEKEKFGERRTHGHKGEFTSFEAKQVFKNISNPRYIFLSRTNIYNPDNYYLIGVYDIFDKKGEPMMLSFHFNKNRNEIEANWVTSIYGKNKNILADDWTKHGYLIYVNDLEIEKAPAEVVTLYMRVSKSASAIDTNIMHKSDFVNKMNLSFYKQNNNIYGFAHHDKIYLNPEIMNSEVAIHEYTHLWDNYIQRTNPELWQKGKDILTKTKFWNEVKNDPNYSDIADDENLLMSEVHARICGKMADEILDKILERDGNLTKNSVINWDNECWAYICTEIGVGTIFTKVENEKEIFDGQEAYKLIQEFLIMPIKDLMNGTQITKYFTKEKEIESEYKIMQELSKAFSADEINKNLENFTESLKFAQEMSSDTWENFYARNTTGFDTPQTVQEFRKAYEYNKKQAEYDVNKYTGWIKALEEAHEVNENVISRNVATNDSVSVSHEITPDESVHENNSFIYKGKTYIPFRSFRESSPLARYNAELDWTIIAQNLDWKEAAVNKDNPSDKDFNVDDFYDAAGGRDKCNADIFYCVDTGRFYVPTDGGLPCVDYENIRTDGYYGEFANFKSNDTYVKSVDLYMRFRNIYEPQIREASFVLNDAEEKYNDSGEIRDFESLRLHYHDYVDIQMNMLTDIIKNAASPEIAIYSAKECLVSYGTSPDLVYTERFSDNLYLRCNLGDFERRDGQRVFVDPDEQEVIDFITTTYNSLHGIENPALAEETKPREYSFVIKDNTEFGTGGFEPVINLTAEQAAKKYLELNDPDTGIALSIPGDKIFSDEWSAEGISIAVRDNDGDINLKIFGDTFINNLREPDERSRTYISAYKELYHELVKAGAKVKYPDFLFDKEKELFPSEENKTEPTAELSEESRPVIITADNIEKLGIKVGTIVKDNEDSYWKIFEADDFMASMYRCDKNGNKLDVAGNTGRSSFGEGLKQLLADGVFTYTLVSPSNSVQKEAAPADFVSSHIHFTGLSKPEIKEHDRSENLTRENKKPDVYLNHSFGQFPGINKWLYQENKNGFVILTALDYEPGVHTVPIKVSDGSNGWKESVALVDYTKTPWWEMTKEDFLKRNLEQYLTSETAAPEKKTNSKKDIKAIREQCREILKKNDSEITNEDKAILAQYEGGGGTGESGRSADAVLNEFYTPDNLIEKVWEIADAYRPGAKRVLEPSAGTGKFANNRPDNEFTMYEIDETSARINRILHPDANVIHGAFQSQFFDKNGIAKIKNYTMPQYDIVIGNPPYGTYKDSWHGKGEGKEFDRYEEYFLSRGIESLNNYGLNDVLVYVVPSGFLKSQVDSAKIKIATEGILIDAYRLPEGTFPTTEVGTDIVIFMRNKDKDTSQSLRLLGNDAWFDDHPEKILGQVRTRTNRFGKEEKYVTPHDGLSVQDELDKISVLCAESVRARNEAIIEGYINDNLEWLVNERQCSREETADMLHLLYQKFYHTEAFERSKVIPLAFGDGQKQAIPEDNNLFTGSIDYSRKFKVGKQELIDVIGILDDTLDYHTVWDRAFAVQHGMEKKDVARLLTWNYAGNQWDLSESHHEFMDVAPEAEQEDLSDVPQKLPEKTVEKSYAEIALESVKNGGAKNSVLDALLSGQVTDNDYKNENALKLLRISAIDDWRSGFYRYDSDLKVIVNVRTLESVLYHSHYNHNRYIIAASDRDGFITPFFDENSPDFKKLTSNQKDKLRKTVEFYEEKLSRIRDTFVGYEDGKFYLKDKNDRISRYTKFPFFVPETNEIAMLKTENTLVAGLGIDYKDYKIWGTQKDIGDVVNGDYDDIKNNYTCGVYYASFESLYPSDGKYDIGRIIRENKEIEDSTAQERTSYPLNDSMPSSKVDANYKKHLAAKKNAALALSRISADEWRDKAIAYYEDKAARHAEKLSLHNAELRRAEDANVVLGDILSHKLTDRVSFEAGSSYVLCQAIEKGTDVLIDGKKAFNIDSASKSLVTYNNYYVTEDFVKALYDRFGGELLVSDVKSAEQTRPVLNKLIKENLPTAPDDNLVNGITRFALDSTRADISGTPQKASFGGHTANVTQSGIISTFYLDGGEEPLLRFNRKSNLLTLYQSSFDSGAIESLENAFRDAYDNLHVTKYVTIGKVHYCDNDGFTVIMPEKASQKYHPAKTEIMSSDEFTKLYGTSWNEDERIFWEVTDYENYVDISKLTLPQSEMLRKSENYYEEKNGKYIHRELFASGDIYQKIAENEEYFNNGQLSEESYRRNRELLESNVPVPYRFEEISVSVKSPFVRNLNIDGLPLPELFLQWATGCNLEDSRNSRFEINDFTQAGISREDIPPDIYWSDITDYIDGSPVKVDSAIKDEDKRKKIANEKANSRKVAAETLFARFLRQGLSKEGQDIFTTSYNLTFNYNKEPDYSRLPLFVYGMNRYKNGQAFTLYEQQIKGVAALSNKGNGLLAYEVGVGKTAAGIVSTVNQIQTGRSERPFIFVPKSVIKAWENDIRELFPDITLNVLGNMSFKNIEPYYDGNHGLNLQPGSITLCTHEALNNISFKRDTVEDSLFDDFADLLALNDALSSTNPRERADAEKKIYDYAGCTSAVGNDNYVFFENTGCDHVTVDEAHRFKNLYKVPRPKKGEKNEFQGMGSGTPSKRAAKMFAVTQYVQRENNDRNVFMLTATPFTNSPLEVYSMLSYIARKELEKQGIKDLYSFCEQYASTRLEQIETHKNEIVYASVMKEFNDVQGLQNTLKKYIDKVDAEEAFVIRPDRVVHPVYLQPTKLQQEIFEFAHKLMNYVPQDGEKRAPVLEGLNLINKASLSPALVREDQLIDPYTHLPSGIALPPIDELVESSPKLKTVFDTVVKNWRSHKDCGQIVYSNIGTEEFSTMAKYLNKQGVPVSAIAIINGSDVIMGGKKVPGGTDEARDTVKDAFNDIHNPCKVLIGSAAISEGMNLNGNSIALYNLTLGWNPTESVQVEGRIHRQGNAQGRVHIVYPLLEDSCDPFLYQKHDEKSSRIDDLFSYKSGSKMSVSGIDPQEAKFALIKNPSTLADFEIQNKVNELEKQKLVYESQLQDYDSLVTARITFTERLNKRTEDKAAYEANFLKSGRTPDEQQRGIERLDKSIGDCKTNLTNIGKKLVAMGIENDADAAKFSVTTSTKIDLLEKQIKELDSSEHKKEVTEKWRMKLLEDNLLKSRRADTGNLAETISGDLVPFEVTEERVQTERWQAACKNRERDPYKYEKAKAAWEKYLKKKAEREASSRKISVSISPEPEYTERSRSFNEAEKKPVSPAPSSPKPVPQRPEDKNVRSGGDQLSLF
ncbi:MAG: Eco57I restriction-modification methylase domain-containing protein [Spirochaetaceae bacterium]|nr:Eco57I restriction-modification methylase domain-containing protein [Spirochaetaceae bacterium]